MYRLLIRFLNAFLGTCALALTAHAQSISQDVVGTAGNEMLTPNITLSYTIGEPAVNYWPTGGVVLTEGFQQNEVLITGISETPEAVNVNVYPNPFSTSFTVELNRDNGYAFTITDALGRHVNANTVDVANDKTTVDMQNMASGIYFLSVVRNHQPVAVYRVIKSSL